MQRHKLEPYESRKASSSRSQRLSSTVTCNHDQRKGGARRRGRGGRPGRRRRDVRHDGHHAHEDLRRHGRPRRAPRLFRRGRRAGLRHALRALVLERLVREPAAGLPRPAERRRAAPLRGARRRVAARRARARRRGPARGDVRGGLPLRPHVRRRDGLLRGAARFPRGDAAGAGVGAGAAGRRHLRGGVPRPAAVARRRHRRAGLRRRRGPLRDFCVLRVHRHLRRGRTDGGGLGAGGRLHVDDADVRVRPGEQLRRAGLLLRRRAAGAAIGGVDGRAAAVRERAAVRAGRRVPRLRGDGRGRGASLRRAPLRAGRRRGQRARRSAAS